MHTSFLLLIYNAYFILRVNIQYIQTPHALNKRSLVCYLFFSEFKYFTYPFYPQHLTMRFRTIIKLSLESYFWQEMQQMNKKSTLCAYINILTLRILNKFNFCC